MTDVESLKERAPQRRFARICTAYLTLTTLAILVFQRVRCIDYGVGSRLLQRARRVLSLRRLGFRVHSRDPSRPASRSGKCVVLSARELRFGTQNKVLRWDESDLLSVDGGYGDIFLGTFDEGPPVAVKRLRRPARFTESDLAKVFYCEYETWGSLEHPCILPLLAHFSADGYHYLVSPYMANGSLASFIVRPDFSPMIGLRILADVADAMAYLHSRGIVHGDIKAQNVLLSSNNRGLLCDFGLSRKQERRTLTPLKGVGSLRWQGPELLEDGATRTTASDVYAFGITISEVVTRDIPYPGLRSTAQVIRAVFERRRPVIPSSLEQDELSRNLWSIAEGCWNKIPDERISMEEALAQLESLWERYRSESLLRSVRLMASWGPNIPYI